MSVFLYYTHTESRKLKARSWHRAIAAKSLEDLLIGEKFKNRFFLTKTNRYKKWIISFPTAVTSRKAVKRSTIDGTPLFYLDDVTDTFHRHVDGVAVLMSAERWFGDSRWRIVEIRQLSNEQPHFRQLGLY
jgi:hypothetical protein